MSEKEKERKRGVAVVNGSVIFMMDFLHTLNTILVRVNGYVCVCLLFLKKNTSVPSFFSSGAASSS